MSSLASQKREFGHKSAGLLDKMWYGSDANPVATTLSRALLLGAGGYGAGRLGTWLSDKLGYKHGLDPHKVGLAAAIALQPLAPFGNYGRLAYRLAGSPKNLPDLPTPDEHLDTNYPHLTGVQKSGELRKALIKKAFKMGIAEKRAEYGLTGWVGPSFDTFLPPTSIQGGRAFPATYTMSEIQTDPYMSPIAKARAMDLVSAASQGKSGLITVGDVARAATGTVIGYAGGNLFGKVLSAVFGGVSPKIQRRLSQTGAVAGLLSNTGILTR